jgi:hypothetical protein
MWRSAHWVSVDPGGPEGNWARDARPALEKPRLGGGFDGGIYGTNTPNVVCLPDGGFRLYFTLIGPTPDNPAGANDYTSATSSICSAWSVDGEQWTLEEGERLSPHEGCELRVVSPDVVPMEDGGWRMYYEGTAGAGDEARKDSGIRSAVSTDGMRFTPEPGWRLVNPNEGSVNSPRVLALPDGSGHRMYASYNGESGAGIVSAISKDRGLSFDLEDGVRIAKDGPLEAFSVFAPEVLLVGEPGHQFYRMFYAGVPTPDSAYILSATSTDGINFTKSTTPVVSPGGQWDKVKSSEVNLVLLPSATFCSAHNADWVPRGRYCRCV